MNIVNNKYDVAKIVTLLLVVFAHSSKMFSTKAAIQNHNINTILDLLTSFIYSFHMPVFIAISGSVYALCIRRGKYKDIGGFVKNKAERLLIPYVFFSVLIVAPVLCLCGLIPGNYLDYFVQNFILCDNNRHLWYVIVLFSIFIVIRSLGDRLDNHKVLIIAVFSVLAISPSLPLLNYFKINKTLHMLLYFYIGYLLITENMLNRLCKNKQYVCFIISCFLTLLFWLISTRITGTRIIDKELLIIMKVLSSVSGIFMIYLLSDLLFKNNHFTGEISKHILSNSYGIYLFHPMIIYLMAYYLPSEMNSFFLCALMFVISFVLSDILTIIMRVSGLCLFIGEAKTKRYSK